MHLIWLTTHVVKRYATQSLVKGMYIHINILIHMHIHMHILRQGGGVFFSGAEKTQNALAFSHTRKNFFIFNAYKKKLNLLSGKEIVVKKGFPFITYYTDIGNIY